VSNCAEDIEELREGGHVQRGADQLPKRKAEAIPVELLDCGGALMSSG
jgi:hypothetical protein